MIAGAVEGDLDEAVFRRIVSTLGSEVAAVHGRNGKAALLGSLQGYNHAGNHFPWVVLIDLDQECDCAPECVQKWLPNPAQFMRLRVVVRSIEAWLLADAERIASFIGILPRRVPPNPDALPNPKQELVNLARRSRRPSTRRDLVPREGSGRAVGPLYNARLISFVNDVQNGWRPTRAAAASASLASCMARARELLP